MKLCFLDTDVPPVRPVGAPRYARRELQLLGASAPAEDVEAAGDDDSQVLHELSRNLEGLSMGIPALPMWEVPVRLQRHTVGVPERYLVPLRRIARAVVCYHDHQA